MMADGMTVRIDGNTAHEPDALVYCGAQVSDDIVEIKSPIIVVEVLSPSTRHIDASAKLAGYFQVPSVQHYLIVNTERRPVIHHARQPDGSILTRLYSAGALRLDPPGLDVDVTSLFG